MSKFGKFKDIFKIGSGVAKVFVPGGVGKVLDVVNQGLDNDDASIANADALKALAADNDEQTQAILALHERLKILEAKK